MPPRRGGAVDPVRYPLAMLNEPPPHRSATALLVEISSSTGAIPQLPAKTPIDAIGVFACAAIAAGSEILVHYGSRYNRSHYDNPDNLPLPDRHAVSPAQGGSRAAGGHDDALLWRAGGGGGGLLRGAVRRVRVKGEGEGRYEQEKHGGRPLPVRSQDDRLRRGAPRHGGARPVGQRDRDTLPRRRGARAGVPGDDHHAAESGRGAAAVAVDAGGVRPHVRA